jgi:hypothetical protein
MVENVAQMVHVFVKLDTVELAVNLVSKIKNFTKCFLHKFYLDIGCRANQSLSCKNNGTCLQTGVCDCEFGYIGATCEKCE